MGSDVAFVLSMLRSAHPYLFTSQLGNKVRGQHSLVGHGLVGPAAGWPAAVTAGNVAQVCDCVSTLLLLS